MTQLPSPVGQNPSLPGPAIDRFSNNVPLRANTTANPQAANAVRWNIRVQGTPETGVPANSGSGLVADAIDDNGNNLGNAFIVERQQPGNWFFGRKVVPPQDTGQIQTGPNFCGLFAGVGAPNNANGVNGDYYFRGDTPGVANQRIYVKSAGVWIGIV